MVIKYHIAETHIDGYGEVVRGFDIGSGANCIYPLLGASLLGWSFVGSDVTDVAIEWAEGNAKSNPQISGLIEIRKVIDEKISYGHESCNGRLKLFHGENITVGGEYAEAQPSPSTSHNLSSVVDESYHRPPVLLGVVKEGEEFTFVCVTLHLLKQWRKQD